MGQAARIVVLMALFMGGCAARGEPVGEPGPASFPDADGSAVVPTADGGLPIDDAGFVECASETVRAVEGPAPVDIIWVVDSSGSMSSEAERVQDNLNGFSTAMGAVGLDYRVVMITTSSFVSVPPPLGGSDRYLLIDRSVNSHQPLQALIDELPTYGSFLRRNAVTHFVAVTDDDSRLDAGVFLTMMQGLLGHAFTLHAIASEEVPRTLMNLTGACETAPFSPDRAAAAGVEYYDLAGLTGGETFSICTTDWAGLFATLTAVIAVPLPLPCVYPLPPPPDGMSLDPMRVNLLYTPSGGSSTVIPYVGGVDGAECASGGWYYDDPAAPTRVVLCPTTCDELSADSAGRVDLAFGCQTELI